MSGNTEMYANSVASFTMINAAKAKALPITRKVNTARQQIVRQKVCKVLARTQL